jgi:hypothetical protein
MVLKGLDKLPFFGYNQGEMSEKVEQPTRRGRRPRLAGTVAVHVPLPKEHYMALDALAAADRTSIAHHIRRAVAEYIEREKSVKWS